MKLNEFFKSSTLKTIVLTVATLLVLAVTFAAGVFIGLEKARFSYNWGENYYRNFVPPKPLFPDRGYLNAHGTTGQIIAISGQTLTVKSRDGAEKNILSSGQTAIRNQNQDLSFNDLKIGDEIVAFGQPDNQGQLAAKLIRVLTKNSFSQ